MTPTTTSIFAPDFAKELIPWLFQIFDDATKRAYRMMWDGLMSFLTSHWLVVLGVLLLVFVGAVIRAVLTGRWGMLGSVLYNYLYFGTLFVVGLVFGPEVFANDYFKLVLVLLYIVCFTLVGMLISKMGFRRR